MLNDSFVSLFPLSLQQLKQQRDKLRQYQKRINLQLEKERLLAKQLLKDGKKECVYKHFSQIRLHWCLMLQ